MFTDYISHSYRVDSDLVFHSLCLTLSAEGKESHLSDLLYLAGKEQSGSARCIELSVVMLFDYFNVGIGENFGGLFCKLCKESDSERHICGHKYGDVF